MYTCIDRTHIYAPAHKIISIIIICEITIVQLIHIYTDAA